MRSFPCCNLRPSPSEKLQSIATKRSNTAGGEPPQRRPQKSHLFRRFEGSNTIPDSKPFLQIKNHDNSSNSFDPGRLSVFLSRKDWFLQLNNEFESSAAAFSPQSVGSILQNQENPLFAIKFYLWVSNLNERLAKDRVVRKVLAGLLWRKGPVVLSMELLNDINNSGYRITEDLLCILLHSWGRLGLGKYVNEVFGQLPLLGFKPSTRIYNAVIDALVKSNSLDLAYFKYQQMPSDNCLPDRFTYNTLIHGVCRLGITDEALRLLKQMECFGHAPNVFTYTMLVDGFCNAKKVEEAFGVLEIMRGRNVAPKEATYRSLINGSFRCLESHKAYQMLSRVLEKEANVHEHACSNLLYSLSKKGMAREALDFMNKMAGRGYVPGTTVFGVVMSCVVNGLGWTEVCGLLDDFIARGGKPGFNACLTVILNLLKEGKLDEADRLMKHMVLDGHLCSVAAYNMIIDSFVKAKLLKRAMGVFDDMIEKGFLPNLITYNTLISGHSKVGDLNMGRNVLKMLLEHGFKPDVFTFTSIIDGLCRAYQIDDAFHCFSEMVEWGVPPNAVTYNVLIRSLCSVGEVRKSLMLFRKMKEAGVDPDVYSFNALILNFCKMNKLDQAQNLFDSMLRFGVVPDNYTYNSIIKALCGAKKIEEAKEIVLMMDANGSTPNSHLYSSIIDALSCMGRLDEAQELVSKCERRGILLQTVPNLRMKTLTEDKAVNS